MAITDQKQVERILNLLRHDGEIIELRALNLPGFKGSKYNLYGYFDNPKKLVKAAWEAKGAEAIYVVANPIDASLFARAANEMRKVTSRDLAKAEVISKAVDVLSRRWLLVSFNPTQKAGMSTSDAEHELALQLTTQVRESLRSEGWADPILIDSGNGACLLYRIDLPTSEDDLVKSTLKAAAA